MPLSELRKRSNEAAKEDSIVGDDGLLYCKKCGITKQKKWFDPFLQKETIVGVVCNCTVERNKQLEEIKKLEKQERVRENCFKYGKKNKVATFENNKNFDPKTLDFCKRYVDKFSILESQGVLFSGGVGTGKSYHAANIANGLIAKDFVPWFINAIDLIMLIQNFELRDYALQRISTVDLLILDDIGAERNTEFSLEQLYIALNTRYSSDKPTIFTTNLSLEEIEEPSDLKYQRIYDRVDEMAPIKLKLGGKSKRKAERDNKRDKAVSLLYGDNA